MFDQTDNGDNGGDGDRFDYLRRNFYAILRGHEVVRVDDGEAWARWFESANRRVAETLLGRAYVSTVFLGMNHNHLGRGRPLWFETMVFRGDNFTRDVYQARYTTWDEAEAGHALAVQWERAAFPAWIDGPAGLVRAHVVGWKRGIVELDNGTWLPLVLVYRNRRRVHFCASTYKRRFGVTA